MTFRKLLALTLIFLAISCNDDQVEPNYGWFEALASNPNLPYLPDSTANYFGHFFDRDPNDRIGLVIEGKYPEARYLSYTVYDNIERSAVNNIVDFQILPDEGSSNPFIDYSLSENRNYTLLIAPDVEHSLDFKNEVVYNDDLKQVGVFIRYYVPEVTEYGNVPLPNIYYIDLESGERIDYDRTLQFTLEEFSRDLQQIARILDLTEILQEGRNIEFYRFSGVGLYPNIDNQYLFSNVKLPPDNLMMLKFKPPVYAQTLQDIPNSDVRYYSMIIGDQLTYTRQTFYDDEFHIASDGFAYLVFGRPDHEVLAKSAGLNFVKWPDAFGNRGIVVYRNLLTALGYENNLTEVPDITENILDALLDRDAIKASTHIGDYAPAGRTMKRVDFLNDFDGFEVAY